MQLSGKWDKIKYAGTSSQCSNSQYALQSHSTFPCTTYSYSSFLFLCDSGYGILLKSAKQSHSVVLTLWHLCNIAHQAPLSMGFSRQNTGVDCPFLLQEIFPTQGSNLGLPHWRQILYCLSHKGSPDSAKPPLISLSQNSRLLRNSYVRGYCFSWDEYFGNERMSLLQYCNNSLGQNDLESRIPFPLEPLKIITEEAYYLLAKMD